MERDRTVSLTNTLARSGVIVAQHRRVGQVLIVTDVSVGPDALVRGQVGSEAEKGRLFRWLLDMGSDSVGMGSDFVGDASVFRVGFGIRLWDSSHRCGGKDGDSEEMEIERLALS